MKVSFKITYPLSEEDIDAIVQKKQSRHVDMLQYMTGRAAEEDSEDHISHTMIAHMLNPKIINMRLAEYRHLRHQLTIPPKKRLAGSLEHWASVTAEADEIERNGHLPCPFSVWLTKAQEALSNDGIEAAFIVLIDMKKALCGCPDSLDIRHSEEWADVSVYEEKEKWDPRLNSLMGIFTTI